MQAAVTSTMEHNSYRLKDDDPRKGKSGRTLITETRVDKRQWALFKEWKEQYRDSLHMGEQLSEEQAEDLQVLLFRFKEVIALNPKAPKVMKGVQHRIPFDPNKTVRPYKARLRRLSPKERAAQDVETLQLIVNGHIRPSTSPWGAATVMVPKKDGGLRYAIDYRMLNAACLSDSQPLPRCDDLYDAVNGAFRTAAQGPGATQVTAPATRGHLPGLTEDNTPLQAAQRVRLPSDVETRAKGVESAWHEVAKKIAITSSFDVAAGFHGVEIAEEDRYKTAFATWTYGLWEWNKMAMGLIGSSSTFQRHMQEVFKGLLWEICVIYIDDCAVFSQDFEQHVEDLTLVLERLSANNISVKITKCVWGTTQLPLLGHTIVAGEGVKPDMEKVRALTGKEKPTTVAALKSFNGAALYYKRFIECFAVWSKPLQRLAAKYKTKTTQLKAEDWAEFEGADKGYEALKTALSEAPVLATPDFNKPFLILSDASREFIAAVLAQRDDQGVERPIAFISRALVGPEKEYYSGDLEGLSVVTACRAWRHYIHASPTVVITDNIAVGALVKPKAILHGRQARYALDLQEYQLVVVHRKGAVHHLPDYLSRSALMRAEEEVARVNKGCSDSQTARGESTAASFRVSQVSSALSRAQQEVRKAEAAQRKEGCNILGDETRAPLAARIAASSLDNRTGGEWLRDLEADQAQWHAAWLGHREADPHDSRTQELLDTICYSAVEEAAARKGNPALQIASNTRSKGALLRRKPGETEYELNQRLEEEAERGTDMQKERQGLEEELSRLKATAQAVLDAEEAEQPEEGQEATVQEGEGGPPLPTREEVVQAQGAVAHWAALREYKLRGTQPEEEEVRHWVAQNEEAYECEEDGLLWRICWRDERHRLSPLKQMLIPPPLTHAVMQRMHGSAAAAHAGHWKTYHRIRESFWWPSMYVAVQRHVRNCAQCQLHGAAPRKVPVAGHVQASRPGQYWAMDVLKFKESAAGYSGVVTAVDCFSKYGAVIPYKGEINSKIAAQALMSGVVKHWGPPEGILTDGGPEFKLLFEATCETLRIKHRVSASHVSQGHGVVEKFNRTIKDTLAHLVDDDDTHWDLSVPWAQLAYNAAPHKALSRGAQAISPSEAHTGYRLHLDIAVKWDEEASDVGELQERSTQDVLAARCWLHQAQEEYRASMDGSAANQRRRSRAFTLGEWVSVQYPGNDKLPQKLREKYAGPFEVVALPADDSPTNYIVKRIAGGGQALIVHVKRLRAYRHTPTTRLVAGSRTTKNRKSKRYEVARIIDTRMTTRGREYKVLWEPCADNEFDTTEQTWEFEEELKCAEKVQAFHKGQQNMIAGLRLREQVMRPVVMDILTVDPTRLLQHICEAAGVQPEEVLLVWASTPCETLSAADPSNSSRGNEHRDHQDPERPAKRDRTDGKAAKAELHDRFLPALMTMAACDRVRGLHYNFLFENPRASLRRRPYMHLSVWPRVLEVVRRSVHLCAFRHYFKKATDLWTSLTAWVPKGTTGDGLCGDSCEVGGRSSTSGRYVHDYAMSVDPKRFPQGKGATARKNAMPRMLLDEVLEAAERDGTSKQRVVIDLCAGYRSMKEAVWAHGLIYVPVDIRDLFKDGGQVQWGPQGKSEMGK